MSNILIDTCFWYAYYDDRDVQHHLAIDLFEYLELANAIIIPHPTLYETINTRFSKHKDWIESFNNMLINNESVRVIDDNEYKEKALELTFDYSINRKQPISFVDMIIRLMLDDTDLEINALVTFNEKDFNDICYQKNIDLISK
jgi:predicted nucleic acid-binding protein